MTLSGTDETIPTLADTLTLIGHRAMVYIELKTPFGEVGELEKRVGDADRPQRPDRRDRLQSLFPRLVRRPPSADPARPGQLQLERRGRPQAGAGMRKSLAALEQVDIARPDFLALGLDMLPSARADVYRAKGMPIVAWTVRSADQWDASATIATT
jgi:glycerophosphoryl diester phosphodiesterase